MPADRPKTERLKEIYKRLGELPPASSLREARDQIERTMREVEDEMTSIPCDPRQAAPDRPMVPTGRMYPPEDDNARPVPGHPDVVRFRSRSHNAFLRANGAMEFRSVRAADGTAADPPESGPLEFSKPGADGRGVWVKGELSDE